MNKIHLFSFIVILGLLFLVSCQEAPDTLVNPDTEGQSALAKPRTSGNIGINIVLNTEVSVAILSDLGNYGKLLDVLEKINAVRVLAKADQLSVIQALPYVKAANPDAERHGGPIDTVPVEDFGGGFSTWNLDAINVTVSPGPATRQVPEGEGVYVGILDSGLKDSWRQYFPQERIAEEYAISFGGGGMELGHVSTQPNKWEHDRISHGTHVTSTVLGYHFSFFGVNFTGVAPRATVIPVKVLNNSGWGWSSVIARGIVYMAELKAGPLADHPVVINMSLGGPVLDAVEQAAIDYAISQGVIIVASAGNEGEAGMGYPGAYAPVISVAASGWDGEWSIPPWWYALDVSDITTDPAKFYITDFSSREKAGQDLDVAAPGSWVVGPYQTQSGYTSYYFLGGTSQAAPHVAGIVALMAEKYPALTAPQAESILEGSALPLLAGSRVINNPDGSTTTYTWGADATGAGLVDAVAALTATP